MGSCCCCQVDNQAEDNGPGMELADVSFSIARSMSAPSLEVDGLKISGYGLALASVSLEQDAGYWEVIVLENPGGTMRVGVSPRRDRQFFTKAETKDDKDNNDDESEDDGTELMVKVNVKEEDVIGIAMQQSDLPMLQFYLNGERVGEINRFRGTVYPAIHLPERGSLEFLFRGFRGEPPNAKFVPILEARGLV